MSAIIYEPSAISGSGCQLSHRRAKPSVAPEVLA